MLYFVKETGMSLSAVRNGAQCRIDAMRKRTTVYSFYHLARASRYLFPAVQWDAGRLNPLCLCSARSENSPTTEYGSLQASFPFLFLRKIEFFSHSRISQRRPPFLQIAAPRYRIGNFRNLSRPSDDLLPAHRPFDTANALDRSMHSTSLRSIDTSDTLHRDV